MLVAANKDCWQGREAGAGSERFFQRVSPLSLNDLPITTPGVGMIGFACDTGVARNQGRPGAVEGPDVLRRALASQICHVGQEIPLYDLGNIVCQGDALEAAQSALADVVEQVGRSHRLSVALGGGHEVAWGHYQGLARAHPEANIGIINFDAHLDLRPLLAGGKGSSGTPFLQIAQDCKAKGRPFNYLCMGLQTTATSDALLLCAEKLKVQIVKAEDCYNTAAASASLRAFTEQFDALYLTICLDVFNASVAPGVSAPQALGLMPEHILPQVLSIMQTGKVIGLDFAELAPCFDSDGRTAKLAASLLAKLLSCY